MITTKPVTARRLLLKFLQKQAPGAIVRYRDLQGMGASAAAVAMALTRLQQEGVVQRVAKGSYRVPVAGRFGPMPATEQQVLQSLLQQPGGKLRGYPTGVAAFNRLGLTTQVTREIEIATPRPGRPRQIGAVRVRYVPSRGEARPDEVPLRQLLDALRRLKRLPDADPATALRQLRDQLAQLTAEDQQRLARLALAYNPATRALVGALLDGLGKEPLTAKLYASLNPLTHYRLGIEDPAVANRKKWRIQ